MVVQTKELAPGIIVYSNVLENSETFIPEFEEAMNSGLDGLNWHDPYILKEGKSTVDHNIRSLQAYGIPYEQSKFINEDPRSPMEAFHNNVGTRIYSALHPLEEHYKSIFGIETVFHDMYNILRYGKGHFFHDHQDDNQTYLRRMSCSYYVNDDYEGGEITFSRFDINYKPNANELIIFPSTYVYNHSVKKVTSGVRYSIVSWLH
jgi:hypothetical protein